jgi:hypothetical protein
MELKFARLFTRGGGGRDGAGLIDLLFAGSDDSGGSFIVTSVCGTGLLVL